MTGTLQGARFHLRKTLAHPPLKGHGPLIASDRDRLAKDVRGRFRIGMGLG